ncbi:MAG: hypothetical protein ACRC24_00350, partial [Vibrionaceae bacterium]
INHLGELLAFSAVAVCMTHFFHHICRLSAPIHPNPLVMIQIPCHELNFSITLSFAHNKFSVILKFIKRFVRIIFSLF